MLHTYETMTTTTKNGGNNKINERNNWIRWKSIWSRDFMIITHSMGRFWSNILRCKNFNKMKKKFIYEFQHIQPLYERNRKVWSTSILLISRYAIFEYVFRFRWEDMIILNKFQSFAWEVKKRLRSIYPIFDLHPSFKVVTILRTPSKFEWNIIMAIYNVLGVL